MTKLTYTAVQEALKESVEEKGADYVYPYAKGLGACKYAENDGSPSCIVGHVLAKLDPEMFAKVKEAEGRESGSFPVSMLLDAEEFYSEVELSFPLVTALASAQNMQDTGSTWGEALASFEREYEYETTGVTHFDNYYGEEDYSYDGSEDDE